MKKPHAQTIWGIVASQRRLIAVSNTIDGTDTLKAARTDPARRGLIQALARRQSPALVLPEPVLRSDAIAELAARHQLPVWMLPDCLYQELRTVAGINGFSPRRSAALLARLPVLSSLSAFLRPFSPGSDNAQLCLLKD